MFAFPSKESPTSLGSVSQKLQFPAKPKPQSPYGLHRFSYTNEHNVAQTALVRTPSPNKDFRKVSSQHNVLESPAQPPINTQQTRPRAMSAGSVRSAKTVNTQNTTETAQTNNSLNTTNSRLSTGISVANSVSEGAVNRDLGKWFQTSTKDPKIAFMQSSLISVLKTTSRSSTPTRSLASNSSFMSVNNKSSASVLSTGERRLPLSTPHASSAWREHYQERGKERVEEFMQVDHLDYLGLAELAATSVSRNQMKQQSGQVDGDGRSTTEDNDYEESGQLTLDQQRSLKDAQDGLMSLQAIGDAVLGATRVQSNINSGGGGGGGGSLSPQTLLGLGTDHAELQAQEMLKRRQRRILQLVKDFRNNNTVKLGSILSSQESEAGTMRRHQLIVAAKQAIEEAARTYNEHTADAAEQLAEYESELSQQNTYYFDLQQQLLESEAQLATAGEEHRQLLTVMQKTLKHAEDRVGRGKVAPLVSRYPQSWFNPTQQNQSHGYIPTDDADADSVFMHLNQQHYHNNNRRRNSFSSNASMSVSELSTHTRHTHNNNHNNNNYSNSAYNNRNQYFDNGNGAQTLNSSKHANQMPSAQLFSEPWVYNVNTAVVASPTSSAGHRMYGPSYVERRAASPSPLPRTTSHISSNYNNINSGDSVVSRSTSASRSRSAAINRRNSNDDASASGGSDSRGRRRYATINGPVSVSPRSTINSRLRSVSAERRNRSAADNDGVTNDDHYPILSSDNESVSIGRAISKLEANRNELHVNSSKYHNNINRSTRSNSHSGPISMLKQEADSGDATYTNSNIYAASALSKDRVVENNFVPNGRRGSYDTVRRTDSTVSHLSVSTVSSHKNRPSNHSHPANNTKDIANSYPPERSILGLQRSPPLSAASHRQRNLNYNNSPSNRDANRRRYSEVTDSTDANYSSIRHHDYALEDIHTGPTRPPVYATESYSSTTNSSSVPPVQGDTQFYPIHYLDAESVGRDAPNSVIIEGKNNRRAGDSRVWSPRVSNADDGHISSSSSSGNDRDIPVSREKGNSAFHAHPGNKASNYDRTMDGSNYKDPDAFMEMKALDYINHYYRGDAGNSISHPTQKQNTKQNQQAPTPWTLSKYNSAPNTSTSSSNNNTSRLNTNSHSNNTGKRTKTPQLAVYRGRGASGDMTVESAQTAVYNNTGGSEVRRASIPKVPVPMVEVVPQVKEPVYHNAAQADMAGYIESMRRRKV